MTVYRLEELFPDDMQARLERRPILVLPFGTVEWHSHHLPLGLDGIVAQAICERIANECDAVLGPVSYWAAGGVPYPHTLRLPGSIIEPLYQVVFEQFSAMGFRVIIAFTGHFGLEQTLALKRAAGHAMAHSPVSVLPLTEYDLVTDTYTGDHAGVGETSLMLALRPELVRLTAIPANEPLDGVLGADPRGRADVATGKELCECIAQRAAQAGLALLYRTSEQQRLEFIEALQAGVAVLEKVSQMRQQLPRQHVPPVVTPAYREFAQALARGDYQAAGAQAKRKLADLTS
jgi:creatinine amidohydrolase